MPFLKFGTCSWKIPSWQGLVYPAAKGINFLAEYAKKYDSVEIDQWFWSLFPGKPVMLPRPLTVTEYVQSVPDDFLFTIKIPNSITLTHYYQRQTGGRLVPNPHFLSRELFDSFTRLLEPMQKNIGMLMFQFEYLNQQKMPGLKPFLDKLEAFFDPPSPFPAGIEIRNQNYLNYAYFEFLNRHNLAHVFLEGYYMPPVTGIYGRFNKYIKDVTVLRLHGPDRAGMEKITGDKWDNIVAPKDRELDGIINMIGRILGRGVDVFLNINNHYEGSAPLTIQKVKKKMGIES